jgi:hypothetical protein
LGRESGHCQNERRERGQRAEKIVKLQIASAKPHWNIDLVESVLAEMGGDETICCNREFDALCLSWSRTTHGKVYNIYGMIPLRWLSEPSCKERVEETTRNYAKCVRDAAKAVSPAEVQPPKKLTGHENAEYLIKHFG